MSRRTHVIFPLFVLGLSLGACGRKGSVAEVTDSQSGGWNPSETRALLGDALQNQLMLGGMNESQARTIVEKGKTATVSSALMLTSSDALAEVKAFTSGATDALNDVGELPAGTSRIQFLKIIAGSNIKVMKELKAKVPDLDLKKSVSVVTSAATKNLDEAGFDSSTFPAAMKEIASSVSENADDAGISAGELKDVFEDSFKEMIASFDEIEGCDKSLYDELLKEMSAGIMSSVVSYTGFENEQLKDLASAVGRAAMSGADAIEGLDESSLLEFAKAVNSGLLKGAGEIENFDKEYFDDISAGASEGIVDAAGSDADFDREKLDELIYQSKLGAEEAAEDMKLDASTIEKLKAASETASKEAAAEVPDYDATALEAKLAEAERLEQEMQAKLEAERLAASTGGGEAGTTTTDSKDTSQTDLTAPK
jgi:hypothetical protein